MTFTTPRTLAYQAEHHQRIIAETKAEQRASEHPGAYNSALYYHRRMLAEVERVMRRNGGKR